MGRISAFRSCAVGRVTFFYEIIFVRKVLNYSELLRLVKNILKIVGVFLGSIYGHDLSLYYQLSNAVKFKIMAFFLRFTTNANADLERGVSSHHANEATYNEELSGLCGFELESETIQEAIEEVEANYSSRSQGGGVYNTEVFGTDWAIFSGKYLDSVPDGHVFLASKIVYKPA